MSRNTPALQCKCPSCDQRGRALSALPQHQLEKLVSKPASMARPADEHSTSRSGPNFLLMAAGAVFMAMSATMMHSLFGPLGSDPFDGPSQVINQMTSVIPSIAGVIFVLSIALFIVFGPPQDAITAAANQSTPLKYEWAPRFLDLRLCPSCNQIFDGDGDKALANEAGFRRLMETVDKRGESRTWVMRGGFSAERTARRRLAATDKTATDTAS